MLHSALVQGVENDGYLVVVFTTIGDHRMVAGPNRLVPATAAAMDAASAMLHLQQWLTLWQGSSLWRTW